MATRLQRVQAIADAVINGTATQLQVTRMVEGNLGISPNEAALLTSAQKADLFFQRIRSYLLTNMQGYEAQAAVAVAQQTAYNNVKTDFTEAP